MAAALFNPLLANAVDLQHLLDTNKATSVQIVEEYITQIDRHEKDLNAFISIATRDVLLRAAASLDAERQGGHIRGPLHGIPIVLKDCFITASSLGMDTTAGSHALVGARSSMNSAIVQKLLDAGLIILGKTNMSEFAGMKTMGMMPGWSAVGGQTLSPYVGKIEENETLLGHSTPGGSSTGSAVAVAAGLSPLALGAETIGSIITPASRAALYALKPTVGVQDVRGLYTLTDFFDSPGPMAKYVADLVILTEVLLGRSLNRLPADNWEGLSVAFLDPPVWKMDEVVCRQYEGTVEQMTADYKAVIAKIRKQGCAIHYPVDLAQVSTLVVDGQPAIMPIAFWEFKNICIPRFLATFNESPVRTLADIVQFNEQNKDICLPPPYTEQSDLIKALENNDTEAHINKLKVGLRTLGKEILDEVFDEKGITIIAAPADSPLCIHAAAAGYPIATVPLGQLKYNGRPFGLCLVAKAHQEETLLRFMAAYEGFVSDPRSVPNL
ncbi:amidase signature domain-containing protein [Podospora didyma]|uniref:Amidase signature domain-containing protein n=1 Tax=Podospora didyma TaxID=330526 RepID=A0AAE0P883_9PEZI|nr:amidase signature domain-containing protein [Podospora didyma]